MEPGPQPGTDTSRLTAIAAVEQGGLAVDSMGIMEKESATLSALESSTVGDITIRSYLWEQTSGPDITVTNANMEEASFTAPFVPTARDLAFRLTIIASNGATASDSVTVTVSPSDNVDADGDGLIEIDTLEMLHNMRFNLAGTGYKTETGAGTGLTSGCPSNTCTGYELTHNLNFDTEGETTEDTSTWTGDSSAGFTLDADDDNDTYFDVDTGGWVPIGDATTSFTATFEGNGKTISNLAVTRSLTYVGFFGHISGSAVIRNIGLINNLADHSGSTVAYVGGLVGWQDAVNITGSYTTGPADSGAGHRDSVGGLVGHQNGGNVTDSYATGAANGGDGGLDYVGGLVGRQELGNIMASYATGAANGGDGGLDYAGGLVGWQNGNIMASYATGAANGGDGDTDSAGGLVGWQNGNITASYATGAANGGAGARDQVGGLAGHQNSGDLTASYATGAANGGPGISDEVGGLLGTKTDGDIISSYGFTAPTGEIPRSEDMPPTSSVAGLTPTNAGAQWNAAASDTEGAWDFGTTSQAPVLRYADYDGSGADYSCDMFPDFDNPGRSLCGTIIPGQYPDGR